jgi:hypothetical protein
MEFQYFYKNDDKLNNIIDFNNKQVEKLNKLNKELDCSNNLNYTTQMKQLKNDIIKHEKLMNNINNNNDKIISKSIYQILNQKINYIYNKKENLNTNDDAIWLLIKDIYDFNKHNEEYIQLLFENNKLLNKKLLSLNNTNNDNDKQNIIIKKNNNLIYYLILFIFIILFYNIEYFLKLIIKNLDNI